jgi:serine phosphatase RsbU (regulator of sigma subunit)
MVSELSPKEPGRRFALLYDLSKTFNSSLNLDEVLNRVMDEVISTMGAERGFVALHTDQGELDFRSARGIEHTSINNPEFQVSRGVVEEVARSGEPVLTSDAQEDDRFRARRSVVDLGLRSIMCTPLSIKDIPTGVIYVDNRITAGIFSRDDLELLTAIASSAAIAIENARLYEVAVEKGRIERELQMAYRVQASLIPQEVPLMDGWEFAASWQPARTVSGDFYDFIPAGDGSLYFVIADVTDKGMPAALFMALSRSLVRASIDQSVTAAKAITKANHLICSDSSLSMPVTLFLAHLDPHSGKISYVNAGHHPPLFFQCKTKETTKLTRTGIFLGFEQDAIFHEKSIGLESGDLILFYTDGVLDAYNQQEEEFGMERFETLVKQNCDQPASALLTVIKEEISEFIGDVPQYDDLTLMAIRRI